MSINRYKIFFKAMRKTKEKQKYFSVHYCFRAKNVDRDRFVAKQIKLCTYLL